MKEMEAGRRKALVQAFAQKNIAKRAKFYERKAIVQKKKELLAIRLSVSREHDAASVLTPVTNIHRSRKFELSSSKNFQQYVKKTGTKKHQSHDKVAKQVIEESHEKSDRMTHEKAVADTTCEIKAEVNRLKTVIDRLQEEAHHQKEELSKERLAHEHTMEALETARNKLLLARESHAKYSKSLVSAPSSADTTAAPSSTTAAPLSNATTAAPLSNATTAAPSSADTTAAPSSTASTSHLMLSRKGAKCKYKGVYFDASRNLYKAKFKQTYLGRFPTAEGAAQAYFTHINKLNE